MYIPLLKIEQTYYAIRNKAQAAPTVQKYIDDLTDILTNHLHHLVAYVTIRKGKVSKKKYYFSIIIFKMYIWENKNNLK